MYVLIIHCTAWQHINLAVLCTSCNISIIRVAPDTVCGPGQNPAVFPYPAHLYLATEYETGIMQMFQAQECLLFSWCCPI